jgi:hypothetical protein
VPAALKEGTYQPLVVGNYRWKGYEVTLKGWIQRDDQFPIGFDEIWERAGYEHRRDAARAFRACVTNFELADGYDFTPLKAEIQVGPGRPSQSWKMTIGAAKRFLASAQTKETIAIIEILSRT